MKGVSVFKGIAMGKPYVLEKEEIDISYQLLEAHEIESEIEEFHKVLDKTINQLKIFKDKTKKNIGEKEAEIFEAHILMAQDPMLNDTIMRYLKEGYKVEAAVEKARKELETIFLSIEDKYIQERVVDLNDICERLIRNKQGKEKLSLSDIEEDSIIIAKDLTPSDTVQMNEKVKGVITEIGGETSHAAIMAKAKGLPALVGKKDAIQEVKNAKYIILDTIENKVIKNPSQEVIEEYNQKLQVIKKEKEKLEQFRDKKAVTADGREIKLMANIGNDSEIPYIKENGGEGIGLFRTEFLYMNCNHFPTEDEQFNAYKKAAKEGGDEIIIRTLDIGGDKKLSYYSFEEEMNPFLGYRAIRFCLDRKDIFKTQLRAILRASIFGNIKIMYPMISSLEELRKANEILEECKKELDKENIPYNKNIKVGIMIEVPAAVMIADELAKEADFFSIGTNDLCQYSLAVDRMNQKISNLYEPLHPGIIRLINKVVEDAHKENKMVGICGEMGGDVLNTKILVGLGLDELSMSPGSIPAVKKAISEIKYEEAKLWVKEVLKCSTAQEIIDKIKEEK